MYIIHRNIGKAVLRNCDVRYELPHSKEERADILNQSFDKRLEYISFAVYELLMHRYAVNKKWRDVTNVTAQLDSGYNAERLVALFAGKKGTQNRGSGNSDLIDGSEVKAFSTLAADDRPRWNHNQFGSTKEKSREEKVEEWLQTPEIFYLRLDDLNDYTARIRIWRIDPQNDANYRDLLWRWEEEQTGRNFQLHHSRYSDTNIANNNCGDLLLPLALELVFENGEVSIVTAERYPGEAESISNIDDYLE